MPRVRASVLAVALLATGVSVGAGPAAAHEDHIHAQLPAAGCFTFKDDAGDAHFYDVSQTPSDPDLDILGLAMRTTPTTLQAFVKVANLDEGPSTTDGHRYFVDFTFNGHVFSMAASHFKNGTGAIRDGLASTGQAGKTVQLGVDVPLVTDPKTDKGFKASGLTATFDPTAEWVLMELPFTDIGKYGGKAFTGTVTGLGARSSVDNYAVGTIADNMGDGTKWTIGDNKCFAVATKLALSVTKYPAQRTVTARLATATGQALGGKTLTYYVNGKRYAVVRTSSTGAASVAHIKPGSTVKVEFGAASGYLGSNAQKKV